MDENDGLTEETPEQTPEETPWARLGFESPEDMANGYETLDGRYAESSKEGQRLAGENRLFREQAAPTPPAEPVGPDPVDAAWGELSPILQELGVPIDLLRTAISGDASNVAIDAAGRAVQPFNDAVQYASGLSGDPKLNEFLQANEEARNTYTVLMRTNPDEARRYVQAVSADYVAKAADAAAAEETEDGRTSRAKRKASAALPTKRGERVDPKTVADKTANAADAKLREIAKSGGSKLERDQATRAMLHNAVMGGGTADSGSLFEAVFGEKPPTE